MRHPDLIGAFVIFIFGLVAIAAALTTPDPGFGVVGPGVLAAWLGGFVLLTAAWMGWTTLRGREVPQLVPIDYRPLASSVGAMALYFTLFVPLGFVVASAAFLVVETRILGSRRLVRDAVAGILFIVVIDFVFVRLIGVQLPRGILSF